MFAIFRVFRKNATQNYGSFAIFKKTSGSFFSFRSTRHRQKLVDQKDIPLCSLCPLTRSIPLPRPRPSNQPWVALYRNIRTVKKLHEFAIANFEGQPGPYVLMVDEVQDIEDWERGVALLFNRADLDIYHGF